MNGAAKRRLRPSASIPDAVNLRASIFPGANPQITHKLQGLAARRAEIDHREIEARLDLLRRLFRKTDRAGLSNPLQSRGDIDAVTHQIAIALLDDVAEMYADAEDDAAIPRARPALRSIMAF